MLSLRFVLPMVFLFAVVASTTGFTASPSFHRRSATASLSLTKSYATAVQRDPVVMMPATIEKEKVKTGAPAVLDRPVTEEQRRAGSPRKDRKGMGNESWEVRIYNDGMNTREHVARSLVQVTGMSEMDAYQTMMKAHRTGIAVVGRWVYEIAEMYHDALRKNGIVCDIVPVDEDA